MKDLLEFSPLCLGYVRVSTGRQELSVDAQTAAVQRAAAYHQLGDVEIFTEPDTSGSIAFLERPQGQALVARVRDAWGLGRKTTLIVPKVDRLGRDTVDVSQTVTLLHSLKARILFLDINVDTRTPMGRAFMQIASVFAELELARIKERIHTAFDHKRALGQLVTGSVPYGWNAVETGAVTANGTKLKTLVDNPEEQRWLLHMAARRQAGLGFHKIAKELNALGVPTKRGVRQLHYRKASAIARFGGETRLATGRWQSGNVKRVLESATTQAWLESIKNEKLKMQNVQAA